MLITWINKYIFPNGCLPSVRQIAQSSEPHFVMEDWHNFGADYDTTLMAWYERFLAAWPEIADNYSERFKRMFTYYLNACAGAFRARDIQLWQVVFSRGVENELSRSLEAILSPPLRGRFQIRLLYLVDSWHFLVPPARSTVSTTA